MNWCWRLGVVLLWWRIAHSRGGDVAEGDGSGHLFGYTCSEGANLLMNVHEKGIRLPAPELLDGKCVDVVEMHGHGSPGSQGMTADVLFGVSELVEANVASCLFEGCVDVVCGDFSPGLEEGVSVCVDGLVDGASVGEDMVHTSSQRLDWAPWGASAFVVDALSLYPIFLIWHADGGFGCGE